MGWFATGTLLLSSGAFFNLFMGDSSGAEPGAIVVGLWLVAYVIAGCSLVDGLVRLRLPVRSSLPLALFVALAAASYTWSYGSAVTLRRSFALAGTVLVGVAIAQRLPAADLLNALRRAILIIAIASLVLYLVGDQRAIDPVHGTLQGVMPTKNTLARAMGIGILASAALAALDRDRRRHLALGAVMAVPLALAGSAGGVLLTLGILVLLALALVLRTARGRNALVATGALLLGTLMVTVPGMTTDDVAGIVGRDPTLTGRTDLWGQAVAAIGDEPWLGHGFGAFWHEDGAIAAARIAAREQWSVPHAHNGLLDVSLDLGIVGGVLALVVVAQLLARGGVDARAGRRATAIARLSLGAFIVVSNVAESSLLRENALFTVILAAALCLPERRAAGDRPAPVPGLRS